MPLQFRRGVDSDRLTITPSVAEPVFATDTKKLFIGDGSTAGGIEISGGVDSASTIALIDSAYVQARSPLTTTADFPDSAGVNTLIDARVNASFINNLTIDADTLGGQAASTYLQTTADFPDSAGVNSLIDTRVNATFINNLTIDADTLGGQAGSHYLNYNNFTNTPTIPTLGTSFVDSAEARELISVTDAGGDGSLAYNNSTGVLTYTGPSASEVRAHFSAGTNTTFSGGTFDITDATIRGKLSGGTGVTYTSGSGAIAIGQPVGTTDSVTFGGLYVSGNLMVNGTTTTINSTTLTVDDKNIVLADGASDANAADSGGITVAGANAQIIYRSSGDKWEFNKAPYYGSARLITSDDALIDSSLTIQLIDSAHVALHSAIGKGDVDFGSNKITYSNVYSQTSDLPSASTYHGMFAHVHATGKGYFAHGGNWIALANASDIPTNNNSLTNGAGYITASSTETLTNKSGNISMFTNDANYLDSTYTSALVDSAYVQARVTAGTDSAATQSMIDSSISFQVDSAYIQLRQSGGAITVQEEGVSLATSATTLNFVGSNVTASGTGATKTITITGGSGGAGGSGISRADFFHYTATNGQTSFTGADDDGQTLSYTPARAAVYLNGILLRDSADYTSTSGDAIVLSTGADASDIVTIINQGGLDSSIVTAIVDSAYVAARAGGATGGTDSAAVIALIDSAHINARIGSAATLTFRPEAKYARLKLTSDQTGITSTTAINKFNTRVIDTSTNNALTSTLGDGKFIIPAGVSKVRLRASAKTSSVTDQVTMSFYMNGALLEGTSNQDISSSGRDFPAAFSGIISCAQNDYFQVAMFSSNSRTCEADDNFTWFELEVVEGSMLDTVIGSTIQLSDLSNVDSASPTDGQALVWDNNNSYWKPGTVASSGGTDSAAVISLIDSSYIQARQSTTSAGATTISTTTFTATADQTTFATSYTVGKINTYLNGVLLVDSADYTASNGSSIVLGTGANANDIVQVVKYTTETIGTLDSAGVTNLIDSDYIQARQSASGGGTVDSADIIAIVDSNYVQARQTATAPVTVTADIFSYTATANQTGFTGADNNNKTLAYTPDNVNVFLNGILLVDSDDYTATGGSVITLQSAASAGDNIQITGYSTTGAARETAFSAFTYTATSGQTAFTGASEEGTSLQYTSRAQVYLNGILLKDSDDYTRTSSSVLTLTDAADSADIIQIHDFSDVRVSSNLINKNYEFTADSGQTTFSGADNNSATLAYQSGYIQVFLNGILLREADYTANNGTSVVLAEGADSGNTLTISKYGYGTTTTSSVATWTERSSTATASAGEKLFIDCSSGVVTVTLPASPDMGSEVRVIDATGNAATNNITIGRNGSKINGADSDLTLDINRAAIGLVYYNTAQGWILMER